MVDANVHITGISSGQDCVDAVQQIPESVSNENREEEDGLSSSCDE